MPEMVSLRTFNLRSLTGHTRAVVARVPIDIPAEMVEDAMSKGMVPVAEAGIPLAHSTDVRKKRIIPTGAERERAIIVAMHELVQREKEGEEGLFTGAGQPNQKRLRDILHFPVQSHERKKLWDEYRQSGLREDPNPTPMTIAEITATAPKRGAAVGDSAPMNYEAPTMGVDAEDLSLDEVLEATGLEDQLDQEFSTKPE